MHGDAGRQIGEDGVDDEVDHDAEERAGELAFAAGQLHGADGAHRDGVGFMLSRLAHLFRCIL